MANLTFVECYGIPENFLPSAQASVVPTIPPPAITISKCSAGFSPALSVAATALKQRHWTGTRNGFRSTLRDKLPTSDVIFCRGTTFRSEMNTGIWKITICTDHRTDVSQYLSTVNKKRRFFVLICVRSACFTSLVGLADFVENYFVKIVKQKGLFEYLD